MTGDNRVVDLTLSSDDDNGNHTDNSSGHRRHTTASKARSKRRTLPWMAAKLVPPVIDLTNEGDDTDEDLRSTGTAVRRATASTDAHESTYEDAPEFILRHGQDGVNFTNKIAEPLATHKREAGERLRTPGIRPTGHSVRAGDALPLDERRLLPGTHWPAFGPIQARGNPGATTSPVSSLLIDDRGQIRHEGERPENARQTKSLFPFGDAVAVSHCDAGNVISPVKRPDTQGSDGARLAGPEFSTSAQRMMFWKGAFSNSGKDARSPVSSQDSIVGMNTSMSPKQRRHAVPVESSDDEEERVRSAEKSTPSKPDRRKNELSKDSLPVTGNRGTTHGNQESLPVSSPARPERTARQTTDSRPGTADRDSPSVASTPRRERDSQGRFLGRNSGSADGSSPPSRRTTAGRASETQLLEAALQRGTFGDSIQALKSARTSRGLSGSGLRRPGSGASTPRQQSENRPGGFKGLASEAAASPDPSEKLSAIAREPVVPSATGESFTTPFRPREAATGVGDGPEHLDGSDGTLHLVGFIEKALQRHKLALAEHHEYFTLKHLGRARQTFARRGLGLMNGETYSGPQGPSDLPRGLIETTSPFADIRDIGTSTDSNSKEHVSLAFITQSVEPLVKALKPHKKESTICVPVSSFKAPEMQVPFFTHCSSTAHNFRAENCSKLLYHPYFWDGSDVDPRMNQLTKHLREGYENLNVERPKMVKTLHEILRWTPYVDALLEELQIEHKDVLRYLLTPDGEPFPDHGLEGLRVDDQCVKLWADRTGSCRHEFNRDHPKWKRILNNLPPSSNRALVVAGVACSLFLRVAGFSLWHFARRAPIVEKLYRTKRNNDEQRAASDKMDDVACRVCQLLNCPYHGITAEVDSSDSEDEGDRTAASLEDRRGSETDNSSIVDYISSDEEAINIRIQCTAAKHGRSWRGHKAAHEFQHVKFNAEQWVDKGVTNMIHKRKPFWPCDHEGSCEVAECRCWKEGITCEKSCGCPPQCKRRFRGCSCAQQGKPCVNRNRCICLQLNRECDPDLCGTCGVVDVLDPVNRYDDDVLHHRCGNASIQRDRPKNTKVGMSQVAGCGLYACEDIQPGAYISEYKGEVCCAEEAERRGHIYDARPNNYLFTVGEETYDLDSMRYGNKTRFINNSQSAANINVEAKLLLCNTVVRIGLFATKLITTGDELFFNYGYGNEITRGFWEVGEAPKPKAFREAAPSRKRRQKMKVVGQRSAQHTKLDIADVEDEAQPPPPPPPKRARSNSKGAARSRSHLDETPPEDDDDDNDYRPSSYLAQQTAALTMQDAVDSDSEDIITASKPRVRPRPSRPVRGRSRAVGAESREAMDLDGDIDEMEAYFDIWHGSDDEDDEDEVEAEDSDEYEDSDELGGTRQTDGAASPLNSRKRKKMEDGRIVYGYE